MDMTHKAVEYKGMVAALCGSTHGDIVDEIGMVDCHACQRETVQYAVHLYHQIGKVRRRGWG